MAGLPRQIIGSFEDIGKDVVREVASVPKDVVGKALESLGTSSGKQNSTTPVPAKTSSEGASAVKTPMDEFAAAKTAREKQAMSRAALEYLAGKQKPKEPSVWERLQQETEQKKQQQSQQAAAAAAATLQPTGSKRPKGDLYAVGAKRAAAERKNARQD